MIELAAERSVGEERLLLLETCGTIGSLALAEGSGEQWTLRGSVSMPARRASERLLPELRGMLLDAVWKIRSLSAIAVVGGPGSFTGVRVGLSVAKGLCEGLDIPLMAVSRLALLAQGAAGTACVHAVLDAGRGEVYWGEVQDGVTVEEEMLSDEEARRRIGGDAVVVCEERVAAALSGLHLIRVAEPGAGDLLGLASKRMAAGDFEDLERVDGNYLRRTEVEIRSRLEERESRRIRVEA